jgi:hypothetical protein
MRKRRALKNYSKRNVENDVAAAGMAALREKRKERGRRWGKAQFDGKTLVCFPRLHLQQPVPRFLPHFSLSVFISLA